MARGGGNKGAGAKGKGGGKPTARSQNYLQKYGYPSERELRREAQGLAGASVPTIRSVKRPYQEQMQSTRDFLAAVQSALADTSGEVGAGYDQAIQQSQGVDQAAQARLAGLGLGADSAGVQAATGARGDSATQNLIANAAAAKNYAAQLPAVASGSASRQNAGLQKNLLDALQNRRDNLSQAFFQALSQVKGQALQEAGMVQSGQQFHAQMRQQNHQFAQNMNLQEQQFGLQEAQFSFQKSQAAEAAKEHAQEIAAKYGYDVTTGKFIQGGPGEKSMAGIAKKYGLTPNEVSTLTAHTSDQVESLLAQGYSWKKAMARAEANGVPPEIARFSVMSIYSNPPPPPGEPPKPPATGDTATDAKNHATWLAADQLWKTHYTAYQAALDGFGRHQFVSLLRQQRRLAGYGTARPPSQTAHRHR